MCISGLEDQIQRWHPFIFLCHASDVESELTQRFGIVVYFGSLLSILRPQRPTTLPYGSILPPFGEAYNSSYIPRNDDSPNLFHPLNPLSSSSPPLRLPSQPPQSHKCAAPGDITPIFQTSSDTSQGLATPPPNTDISNLQIPSHPYPSNLSSPTLPPVRPLHPPPRDFHLPSKLYQRCLHLPSNTAPNPHFPYNPSCPPYLATPRFPSPPAQASDITFAKESRCSIC